MVLSLERGVDRNRYLDVAYVGTLDLLTRSLPPNSLPFLFGRPY